MEMHFSKWSRLILVTAPLSACMVGPDFVKPEAPMTSAYTVEGDQETIGSQHIKITTPIKIKWWNDFKSSSLDNLIQMGMENNYDLMSAQESLEEAKEKIVAQSGQLWPQFSLNASTGRQKYGVALFGPADFAIPPYTYYEVGPSLNYALDIFGGTRRTIEKQEALMTYQNEVLNGTYLSLIGNIVTTAIMNATVNEQIETSKQIIKDDRQNLNLVQQAFDLGSATKTEILSAQSQLESDEALLPALYQQLNIAKNAMRLLVGTPPGNWQSPNFKLNDFALPQDLPMIIPSELVRKRPDILAAEAVLHAASADVGIATANLYPNINLTGTMLQESLTPRGLFNSSANAWSVLGGITAPIFNGGALRAERRAAKHAYQSSYANYQQVVLKAFVQVSDTLHAISHDTESVNMEERAVLTAKESLRLARLSYNEGNVGILQVLDAERLYTQARIAYVRAVSQRYQDTVQLYVVLGGAVPEQFSQRIGHAETTTPNQGSLRNT